jgi:hypothetical protein
MELGPDALCTQVDDARVVLASAKSQRGGRRDLRTNEIQEPAGTNVVSEEVSVAMNELAKLRELVHIRRGWLRTGSLGAIAQSAAPELYDKLMQRILGPEGLVAAARLAMARDGGVGEIELAAISRAVRACGMCMRLKLLSSAAVTGPFAELTGFLAAHVPGSRADALVWRRIEKDARLAEELAEKEGTDAVMPLMRKLVDAVALRCIGAAAGNDAVGPSTNVVRFTVEASFVPAASEILRSGILSLLIHHLPGARLRAIRVEPVEGVAVTAAMLDDRGRGKTIVDVAIETSPRGTAVDCKFLSNSFADLSSHFSAAARGQYGVTSVCLLSGCIFLSLSLAPVPLRDQNSADDDDFHDESGSRMEGVARVFSSASCDRQRLSRKLRDDLAEAMELPRNLIRVVRMGSCMCRAVVELAAVEGLVCCY